MCQSEKEIPSIHSNQYTLDIPHRPDENYSRCLPPNTCWHRNKCAVRQSRHVTLTCFLHSHTYVYGWNYRVSFMAIWSVSTAINFRFIRTSRCPSMSTFHSDVRVTHTRRALWRKRFTFYCTSNNDFGCTYWNAHGCYTYTQFYCRCHCPFSRRRVELCRFLIDIYLFIYWQQLKQNVINTQGTRQHIFCFFRLFEDTYN